MTMLTKEQLIKIIDSGEPILVVRASDPRSFAIASIIKSVYVTAQLFENAAYAREVEKGILKWRQENGSLLLNPKDDNPMFDYMKAADSLREMVAFSISCFLSSEMPDTSKLRECIHQFDNAKAALQ